MRAWVLLLALLAGCSAQPQIVEVGPLTVPCNIPDVPRPTLRGEGLKIEDPLLYKVQVLLADRELLIGYTKTLEAAVIGCKLKN